MGFIVGPVFACFVGFSVRNRGVCVESPGFVGLSAIVGGFVVESHGLAACPAAACWSWIGGSLEFRGFVVVLVGCFGPGVGVGGCCCGTQRENRGGSC